MMYVGEGPRGSNGARFTLLQISIFHSTTHNQTGPLWCWFPSGWACSRSRSLWVSPMTSPVRLGVSPIAASTPMGVFNQKFEALFPCAGALGCEVCPGSSSRQLASSPLCPGCPSPPLLPVWMNVYFLSPWCRSDFLVVDFLSVLVVRGGAVCLPMPPSWFSFFLYFNM